ncbi:RNA recognition motif domain [Macleaya cordata]|uniref:RNA recognition motif domain n=1 Tax=Macleaya cordata TaxID=56857 RepID=A0A200QUT1_MACCD|nr:RNA recognition motif domain [Macleaya cordata]
MSHFGRSGPPDIRDTYSLLVLNITFRTTADDLFPLFDKYGKVVDIFIPRDRRTGDSRGFAFVRYKYAEEAQKAVEKLDGRNVDGRDIMVQFAKYGPNAERIRKEAGLGAAAHVKGPVMITGAGITEGEVVVGVGKGMMKGLVGGERITAKGVGAAVQVLITTRVVVEVDMRMSEGGLGAGQLTVLLLFDAVLFGAVLVLEEGAHHHAELLLPGVKVQIDAAVMIDLQSPEVFRHNINLLSLEAHPHGIQMLMIDARCVFCSGKSELLIGVMMMVM